MAARIEQQHTIAAIATPMGEGSIAAIRLSGERAIEIFRRAFAYAHPSGAAPNRLCLGHVVGEGGEKLDQAMGVIMPSPHSYTKEDVCEIHCHGGRMAAARVLNRVVSLGASLAQPGEFTKRAFQNGRIDLSEAEAVMALICAESEAAARAAVRQMSGGLSRFVVEQKARLVELLSKIEAGNDFPEEIDEQATASEVLSGIADVREALETACDERAARIVREGISVVLVGKPNVGKSSLMNAMLGQNRAIVTGAPGTTRDVLTERLKLGGLLIELSDTAGQRETRDEVEKIGVSRAKAAEKEADIVLLVLDASVEPDGEDRALIKNADERAILVLNKTDIAGVQPRWRPTPGLDHARVCALTGEGIAELIAKIEERCKTACVGEQQMIAPRHIECARRALDYLAQAERTLGDGFPVDLAAVDLMAALSTLAEITGESASESVIDAVFANFCVGK